MNWVATCYERMVRVADPVPLHLGPSFPQHPRQTTTASLPPLLTRAACQRSCPRPASQPACHTVTHESSHVGHGHIRGAHPHVEQHAEDLPGCHYVSMARQLEAFAVSTLLHMLTPSRHLCLTAKPEPLDTRRLLTCGASLPSLQMMSAGLRSPPSKVRCRISFTPAAYRSCVHVAIAFDHPLSFQAFAQPRTWRALSQTITTQHIASRMPGGRTWASSVVPE